MSRLIRTGWSRLILPLVMLALIFLSSGCGRETPPPAVLPSAPSPPTMTTPAPAPKEGPVIGAPPAPTPGEAAKIVFESHGAIHIINPDGSDEQRLTSGKRPLWSPDGQKILFSAIGEGWGIVDADGSNQTIISWPKDWFTGIDPRVMTPSMGNLYDWYRWSPMGDEFLFAIHLAIPGWGREGIYLVNVADGSFTRLVRDKVLAAAFSPDGREIAFLATKGSIQEKLNHLSNLYLVDVDGANRRKLTDRDLGRFDVRDSLSWSPDGKKIAYASGGDPLSLFVIDSNGANEMDLGHAPKPIWLPDSKSLAYRTNAGIYTVRVDGTGRKEILRMTGISDWSLSPDGAKLAVYRDDGVYTLNLDGSGLTRIVIAEGRRRLDWSLR